MRNLRRKQQQAREKAQESAATAAEPSGAAAKKSTVTAAQLRAQGDIQEMDPIPGLELRWPDEANFMRMQLFITPNEGLYKGATYEFEITVPQSYPHDPPKCLCKTLPLYHPNFDWDGNPCLNILREDWRPVLSLSSVLQGLLFLFLEPNPYDPLNHEVAEVMKRDEKEFEKNVRLSLRGGTVAGRSFPRLR